MTGFTHTELLPLGPDHTTYDLVASDGIGSLEAGDHRFLTVDPGLLTEPTARAMHEIAHYLRAGHLAQLRAILDDPEASANDRFVALDLPDHCVYYAGPAKTPEGYASSSFGPTTAGRMDACVDQFQAAGGSHVMLAKGNPAVGSPGPAKPTAASTSVPSADPRPVWPRPASAASR